MTTNHTNKIAVRARGAVGMARLALSFMLLASNPIFAQSQCGQGQGKGADISMCADEILAEQERSLDLLEQMTQTMGNAGLLKAEQQNAVNRQLGFMRSSHGRGRTEKNDTTVEEFDSLITKGAASSCELRLLPRYSMGPPPRPICTDEQIAANKCEEVCEFSPGEQARNDERGLRLEEDLANALEQTKIANDEIASSTSSIAALSVQAAAAAPCYFDNPHPNVAPVPPSSMMVHNQLLVAQETITEIGKDACQQDAAGFNAATACIVLDVLNGIQKGLTTFITTVDGNYTSAKVDATFDCVNALKSDSDDQGAQIDELENKIDDIQGDVAGLKILLDEVRVMLITPQGQREEFPEN